MPQKLLILPLTIISPSLRAPSCSESQCWVIVNGAGTRRMLVIA